MAATSKHAFHLPTLGGDDGQWGDKLNQNWALLDSKLDQQKTMIVNEPTAVEDITFFFTKKTLRVLRINSVLVGAASPSITYTIKFATDRSAAGTELVTGGSTVTSVTSGDELVSTLVDPASTDIDVTTIPPNSYIWVEISGKTGTVGSVSFSLFFYEED